MYHIGRKASVCESRHLLLPDMIAKNRRFRAGEESEIHHRKKSKRLRKQTFAFTRYDSEKPEV